jgi:hypothetical protein
MTTRYGAYKPGTAYCSGTAAAAAAAAVLQLLLLLHYCSLFCGPAHACFNVLVTSACVRETVGSGCQSRVKLWQEVSHEASAYS